MAKSTLIYDGAHMRDLAKAYQLCALQIDRIYDQYWESTNSVHAVTMHNYYGQGSFVLEGIFTHLCHHLSLLSECCTHMSEYVLYTLAAMQAEDRKSAERWKDTDKGGK
jgi:hypothetical protein